MAGEAGFNEEELKVIFNGCLNKPLESSEMRMLMPLGFLDMVRYAMNREKSGGSYGGSMVAVTTLEDPVPSASSPFKPAP